MYQPTTQDFTNALAWQALVNASLQQGPIPAAPSVLPTGGAAVKPLPDGVVFDSSNTGAVKFTAGVTNPQVAGEIWDWIGALPSLAAGSPQYAQVSWNVQTAKFEESVGMMMALATQMVATQDSLTGANSYKPDSTGKKIAPDVHVIPSEYDTLAKALAYVNNPKTAKALYG